ncbi:MAG: hypothetical protein KAG14_02455, partial [Mycoplasmataceae bacterium]|nr:hypothetical protein [Mycoplasmataceae bacterium]
AMDGANVIVTTTRGFYVGTTLTTLATTGTFHDKTPFTLINKVFVIESKKVDGTSLHQYWFAGNNGMFSVEAAKAITADVDPNANSKSDSTFDNTQRYESNYYLYNTQPFIQSNIINDISINANKDIIKVMTSKGLSEIHRVPTTMNKKVRLLQKIEDANFKRGFGLSSSRTIEGLVSSDDNDGLRTSLYLLSQTRAYTNVTGTKPMDVTDKTTFKANILKSFGSMEKLFSVHSDDATDKDGVVHKDALKGFPARSYVDINSITHEALSDKIENDNWVRSKKNADFMWKHSTSSDEYIGHYAAYWDLFKSFKDSSDPQLKAAALRAGKLIMAISSSLLRNNLSGRNARFEITSWARFNPTYINFYPEVVGDKKLNSSLIIMFLQAALQVSTDTTMGTMTKEPSIKPGVNTSVNPAKNYGFALAKLLSDMDEEHYEKSPNALFKNENFYKARKHGKNNDNSEISDLKGTTVKLGSKDIEAFDFWKQETVTGAGYFANVTRPSNEIKHFASSASSFSAKLYSEPNKSIKELVLPYESGSDEAKQKYVQTEEEYNGMPAHKEWHPRYADTKLSNGQSFDTMSNEYNYSDDEEYFLVYPALIDSAKGIFSKIESNLQGATLGIANVDSDSKYVNAMKMVSKDAANVSKDDGIGMWNLVGKMSGQDKTIVKESTDWTLKIYLQDFPLDNRGRGSNGLRKDIPLNKLYKYKDDLGDPGSNPYNANAAWHHRPTLSVLPSHGIHVSWHNNSGYDRSFRVTSEFKSKFSLNGASFLTDYYAYLLSI